MIQIILRSAIIIRINGFMKEQVAIQKIILSKYEEARAKNPSFSRRAFSKRLGLSAGAISEIFNGQRRVSLKLAEKIVSKLDLDPQERSELFSYFPKRNRRKKINQSEDKVESNYLQLSADQFHVIGDWYHFAILTLLDTEDFRSEPSWIAKRLNLSISTVETALDRLVRLEVLSRNENGDLQKSEIKYRTTDDISNISVKKAHKQYLEKAQDILNTLPVNERDFTSLMFPLNAEDLPRAKEMIRKFQDDLAAEFSTKGKKDVYQICMQLFPLTKNFKENKKQEN